MSTNELLGQLIRIGDKKERVPHVVCRTSGGMAEHTLGYKGQVPPKLYALTVLAGIGKDKEPMSSYDGDLQVMLNKRRFFSTNIGLHFDNQRARVLHDLMHKWHQGTFIFTDIYGLQKASFRPRLWTVNFEIDARTLIGHVVFGHCDLFPMLPYEVLGVAVVGDYILKMTGMKELNWVWYFHSITNKNIRTLEPQPMFTNIPELHEIMEVMRLEGSIRNFKPKIAPIPNMPLPTELDEFVKLLFEFWRDKK